MCIDSQVAHFQKYGFVVIENALDEVTLNAMRAECEKVTCTKQSLVESCGCILEPIQISSIDVKDRGNVDVYQQIRGNARTLDAIQTVYVPIASRLLKKPVVYLINEQFIVKEPNSSSAFALHLDCDPLVELGCKDLPQYISLWSPLDDVNEENGTLKIYPFGTTPKEVGDDGADDDDDGSYVVYANAGTVVIMDSTVPHRSFPNISSQPRRVYMPQISSAPITKDGVSVAWAIPFGHDSNQ